MGASLLRSLLTGELSAIDANRTEGSTGLLFEDLDRQGLQGVTLKRNARLKIDGLPEITAPILVKRGDGLEFVLGLHNPLTADEPGDAALRGIQRSDDHRAGLSSR